MKQTLRILVAAGLITCLFTIACNKNSHPEEAPDNISNAVILTWNEIVFEALGGSTNEHSLLGSRIYAMTHAAMHDTINATRPQFEDMLIKAKTPWQILKLQQHPLPIIC